MRSCAREECSREVLGDLFVSGKRSGLSLVGGNLNAERTGRMILFRSRLRGLES